MPGKIKSLVPYFLLVANSAFANPYASIQANIASGPVVAEENSTPSIPNPVLPIGHYHVVPTDIKHIKWIVLPTQERSANTGQLTCNGWSRTMQLVSGLDVLGPFNAAVVSPDTIEDYGQGKIFLNNVASSMAAPFAAKWDIASWSSRSPDTPAITLSAIFRWSFQVPGSANLLLVWDSSTASEFLSGWIDGLIKAKVLDGLQGLSWKQKISMPAVGESKVGVLSYTVASGTIRDLEWRLEKIRLPSPTFGCSGVQTKP